MNNPENRPKPKNATLPKNPTLRDRVRSFPTTPGVYQMKDKKGTIIYIGKAKNLRSRLLSYFSRDIETKTAALMERVIRIEYILTNNEYDALMLESTLIKHWRPHYNFNLKDDKSYPVIRMTKEQYPRVFKTHRQPKDGSKYWGPYTRGGDLVKTLEIIESIYPLRRCRGPIKKREHPCLYFHIGRCSAPCAGKIDRSDYLKNIAGIRSLLNGNTKTIERDLRNRIQVASQSMQFERAATLRDTLRGLGQIRQDQTVIDFDPAARDYIGYAQQDQVGLINLFSARDGRLLNTKTFHADMLGTPQENIERFIAQYYENSDTAPSSIYLPLPINRETIKRYLNVKLGRSIAISAPLDDEQSAPETPHRARAAAPRKRHASLIRMAIENAKYQLQLHLDEHGNHSALVELRKALQLDRLPLHIEGFDIAHVDGKHTIAAMVFFRQGIPQRSQYRQYRIRTLDGRIDDFEALREAVARRYTRQINEKRPLPDLLLIDGGLGQVNAAQDILHSLDLHTITVISIAKRNETLFFPNKPTPLALPRKSRGLRLLQYVRDESHRFATMRRSQSQERELRLNLLTSIPGIGPKRAQSLIQFAGSLDGIAETPPEKLSAACSIPLAVAKAAIAKAKSE